MDFLHENSVSAISLLQNRFYQQKDFMFAISTIFDPRYAFLFFSPLVFSLDRYAGRKLMWVAVFAEWANMLLKWILHGERPYWWIHETNVYNKTHMPDVQQFFLTCETGPGSPSGHAMVTAASLYVIIEALLRRKGTLTKRLMINRIFWSVYTIIVCTVSLSRVYIAAHFPHQCALGMIIGIAVAILVSNLNIDRFQRKHYFAGTLFLLTSVLSTFVVLKAFGMNPMWSVDRALKWCAKREYVHLDTTPFFSVTRFAGFFLGMGIGLHSSLFKRASKVRFTTPMKILSAILSLAACKASEFIALPSNTLLFYSSAFAISSILPLIFIALIPFIIAKIASPDNQKNCNLVN
ncbi:glucose-6-phosphatase-like protein [Leptotrombidium deliense]|uniref:Glucose-6-phosphatase n=1 Tax=Leptotrombidium deliense TaxID=299467 RepID=A0A443SGK7_9ACAR|nr:glucose-6-phosphatase-like protein [Leptotrombidium deliense]